MTENDLQRVYTYSKYSTDSEIITDKGFVNIDNGQMDRTHWVCFIVKENRSCYFHSFVGSPDNFLLKHLSKPLIYRFYKIQDNNSKLCGSYSLYFFYLIERMD